MTGDFETFEGSNHIAAVGTIHGGAGNDSIFITGTPTIGAGTANVYGDDGNDTIRGTTASDIIHTGGGTDVLWGGGGSDQFYFDHPGTKDQATLQYAYGDGSDTIYGFAHGSDTINIARISGDPDPTVTAAVANGNTTVPIAWDASHSANIVLAGVQLNSFIANQDYHLVEPSLTEEVEDRDRQPKQERATGFQMAVKMLCSANPMSERVNCNDQKNSARRS